MAPGPLQGAKCGGRETTEGRSSCVEGWLPTKLGVKGRVQVFLERTAFSNDITPSRFAIGQP